MNQLRQLMLEELQRRNFATTTIRTLLIQSGASIVYVKEQMGHFSIQVTVNTYGHLVPGADISFVDRLDEKPRKKRAATQHNATPAQLKLVARAGNAT